MSRGFNLADKLHCFTVCAASSIILIAGLDAFLEHHSIPGADTFVATAGFLAFLAIIIGGWALTSIVIKPILKAIEDLNVESAEAAAASSQVEAASQDLAEATLEESASIQETAATLEETSSMVQQNSANTQEAAALSKQAMAFAEKSYVEMKKLLDYMDKLKQSSEQIFKIAKVIDTIAFQTNILSLNAAVEAAKIGREGNSFAVVAEEVGKLAHKSDEAAKSTEDMLTTNMQLVNEGLTLAIDVEDALSDIDQESKKISALMDEISVASAEQSRGVNEIHKAVAQMEIAVHSNAHSAEECSCAASSLSSQADCVKNIIDKLSSIVCSTESEKHEVSTMVQPRVTQLRPTLEYLR